jgi:sec-independent protein translocase protein TatA
MLAMFGLPGGMEWLILLALGLLLFGRRLPEIGRAMGRTIVEFKKGVKGIEDEVDGASVQTPGSPARVSPANRASLPADGAPPAAERRVSTSESVEAP